jgi:hypothetical protein
VEKQFEVSAKLETVKEEHPEVEKQFEVSEAGDNVVICLSSALQAQNRPG